MEDAITPPVNRVTNSNMGSPPAGTVGVCVCIQAREEEEVRRRGWGPNKYVHRVEDL